MWLPTTAFEPCDLASLRDATGKTYAQQLKEMAFDLLSKGEDRVASSLLALAFEEMDGDVPATWRAPSSRSWPLSPSPSSATSA